MDQEKELRSADDLFPRRSPSPSSAISTPPMTSHYLHSDPFITDNPSSDNILEIKCSSSFQRKLQMEIEQDAIEQSPRSPLLKTLPSLISATGHFDAKRRLSNQSRNIIIHEDTGDRLEITSSVKDTDFAPCGTPVNDSSIPLPPGSPPPRPSKKYSNMSSTPIVKHPQPKIKQISLQDLLNKVELHPMSLRRIALSTNSKDGAKFPKPTFQRTNTEPKIDNRFSNYPPTKARVSIHSEPQYRMFASEGIQQHSLGPVTNHPRETIVYEDEANSHEISDLDNTGHESPRPDTSYTSETLINSDSAVDSIANRLNVEIDSTLRTGMFHQAKFSKLRTRKGPREQEAGHEEWKDGKYNPYDSLKQAHSRSLKHQRKSTSHSSLIGPSRLSSSSPRRRISSPSPTGRQQRSPILQTLDVRSRNSRSLGQTNQPDIIFDQPYSSKLIPPLICLDEMEPPTSPFNNSKNSKNVHKTSPFENQPNLISDIDPIFMFEEDEKVRSCPLDGFQLQEENVPNSPRPSPDSRWSASPWSLSNHRRNMHVNMFDSQELRPLNQKIGLKDDAQGGSPVRLKEIKYDERDADEVVNQISDDIELLKGQVNACVLLAKKQQEVMNDVVTMSDMAMASGRVLQQQVGDIMDQLFEPTDDFSESNNPSAMFPGPRLW